MKVAGKRVIRWGWRDVRGDGGVERVMLNANASEDMVLVVGSGKWRMRNDGYSAAVLESR